MAWPQGIHAPVKSILDRGILLCRLTPNQLIRELHHAANLSVGDDDQSQRGTQLLEIYALEIQMYNETKNFKKLKVRRHGDILAALTFCRKYTMLLTTFAQPFPTHVSWVLSRSVGERCGWENVCFAMLELRCRTNFWTGQWNRASEDFFESFRNYDEAGSPQRIQVLKYLVLANMLMGSEVNPFDSQETKP